MGFLTYAEEDLVVENMALVHWTVRRLGCSPAEYDDRVQDGMFGLMRAAQLYDPSRGAFSTHAVPWIRQSIGRGRDTELGSARRSALRNGDEWRRPIALDASDGDRSTLADTLIATEADPAEHAEQSVAVAAAFAACTDDLDRAVLMGVAAGVSYREIALARRVSIKTVQNRLDRLVAALRGGPPPRPMPPRCQRASCVECGSPCTGTRCLSCHNTWALEQMPSSAA